MKEDLKETTWGRMLRDLRVRSGLSKSALARSAGVSIGYISKLETGKKPPPESPRQVLCDLLGLSQEEADLFHIRAEIERTDPVAMRYLMKLVEHLSHRQSPAASPTEIPGAGDSDSVGSELHTIPIINKAAAGQPQEFTDLDYPVGVADGYLAVPDLTDPNAFGFYVSGDSMEPDFPDGTLLIAAPNAAAFDGNPCFIRFSPVSRQEGCSFKRVYFMPDGRVRLVPINRQYAEQIFERQELTGIWPVVRGYFKINRGGDKKVRRTLHRGGKPEVEPHRPASAAG